MNVLKINDAIGTGGGQVLRASLALSMALGIPFAMEQIRAGRSKPGLMRQHLTCVRAAAALCNAQVEGDEVGSTTLTFAPGKVQVQDYEFAIDTGGSTALVMQALVLALAAAVPDGKRVRVRVTGGTYCPGAPSAQFLMQTLGPALTEAGYAVQFVCERHGFYSVGGGCLAAEIGSPALRAFSRVEPESVEEISGVVINHNLEHAIGARESEMLQDQLRSYPCEPGFPAVSGAGEALGAGNAVILQLRQKAHTAVVSSIGRLGVSARTVAQRAIDEAIELCRSCAPVDRYLADQLLVPLVLARGGSFLTVRPSAHLRTCAEIVRLFTGKTVTMTQQENGWLVTVPSL